jgi:hypothetical protein
VTSDVAGIRIETPGDWQQFDLRPATRHRSMARMIRRARNRDSSLLTRDLVPVLDMLVAQADDLGAFFLSACAGLDPDQHPFALSVLMHVSPARSPYPDPAWVVCADWAESLERDVDADVSAVTLPSLGCAVRIEGAKSGVQLDFLVPLTQQPRDLLVTFASSCAMSRSRHDDVVGLFDAMAQTLAFLP